MQIIINGETISDQIYQQEFQRVRMNNQDIQDEKELAELTKQSIVDWTILRQEAARSQIQIPKETVDKAFEQMKEEHGGEDNFYQYYNLTQDDDDRVKEDIAVRLKVDQLMQNIAGTVSAPDEAAIKQFYNENKTYFVEPEQVHVAHIVKQPNPQNPKAVFDFMMDLRQKLLDGADFKEMADQNSSCQDPGGDLGYFARGKMVPEFETVVFSMNTGEISPIFQTQFGYHIATVYDKKEAAQKSLKQSREEIIQVLTDQMKNDKIADWVDEKKKDVKVEYVEEVKEEEKEGEKK